MAAKIYINADMGVSYGRRTQRREAKLIPSRRSANIACG